MDRLVNQTTSPASLSNLLREQRVALGVLAFAFVVALLLDVRLAGYAYYNPAESDWRGVIRVMRWPGHFGFTMMVAVLVGLAMKHWRYGVELVLAGIASGVVVVVMKWATGRIRPFRGDGPFEPSFFINGLWGLVQPPPNLSFPSGDVALAASTAMVVSHYFPRLRVVAWGWAVVVAYARVRVGAHYPSDVCVGLIVGLLSGLLAIQIGAILVKSATKSAEKSDAVLC
jgi:undecaprenyl-diphosphatase